MLFLLTGCAAEMAIQMSDEQSGAMYDTGWDAGAADTGAGSEADDADDYAPEDEVAEARLKPAATRSYLFVVNPERDTLTRVTLPELTVLTAPVGDYPLLVTTTDDDATAVTLNIGDDTLSVVDAATLASRTVSVREDLNAVDISPDGAWALVWADPDVELPDDAPVGEGVQSSNEVSLVHLASATDHALVVGARPQAVQFTEDSRTALVVSETWLTLIDLSADEPVARRVSLTEETVDAPAAEEVVITPDGATALVRQFGGTSLAMVDLVSGALTEIDVGTNPTDLDVTSDGATAIVVARASSELWLLDTSDPTATPRVVSLPGDAAYGSITLDEDLGIGLLYSTATGLPQYATWDMETDEVTEHGLVKPVSSVTLSPDGGSALVFHPIEDGEGSHESFQGSHAVTLLDMSDQFTVPLRLEAEPLGSGVSDDGQTAYLVLEESPWLNVLHLDSLLHDAVPLASAPINVGVFPQSSWAWVNQDHELGRLSFYDPESAALQTLTGFELNAAIEHD